MSSNSAAKVWDPSDNPLIFDDKLPWGKYGWTFWLIAISNINFFLGNIILFITFTVALAVFITRNYKIHTQFETYVLLFVVVLVGQSFWYMNFALGSIASLGTRIVTAYLIISIVGKDFFKAFIDVMYFFAILSLVMWLLIVISPAFYEFMVTKIAPLFDFYFYDIEMARPAPHVILFTFNHGAFINDSGIGRLFIRNSGPFTEPSVYAPYLTIAFSLNYMLTGKTFDKKNLFFIIAMFTSYSTGGFVVLGLLGAGAILMEKGSKKIILLPIAMIVFLYSFINVAAFGDEIEQRLDEVQTSDLRYANRTRLVNALLDLEEVFIHPVFGKGFYKDQEEKANASLQKYLDRRTNGTTKFLNRYGFFGFFVFFYFIYMSYKSWALWTGSHYLFSFLSIFALMLVGFGNSIFEKPFFFALGFVGFVLKDYMRMVIEEYRE